MPDSLLGRVRLPVIVLAQFAGTSLWFAGNAILPDIQPLLNNPDLNGWITSAVQLGFIGGTLLYALLAIPDRFPTTRVFLVSVLLAAAANAGWLFLPLQASTVLVSRALTGFFLAGVYPVGMKLAADWFRPVLGRAMGFLVGALVLGTAFPHLLRGLGTSLPYRNLMLAVSGLAIGGGILLYLVVPSKPLPTQRTRFQLDALRTLVQPSAFRPAMFGYFGHMWELYTVWAFLPLLIGSYNTLHPAEPLNVSLTSFLTIAAGMLGCVLGGYGALQIGSRRVARYLLITSGLCLLLLPLLIGLPPLWFALFLAIWGAAASGDSPQFSTLVASYAPAESRGSTLTLVTSIGFLITVISIQTMAGLVAQFGASVWLFWLLLPGPLLGVLAVSTNDERS
ncbi:MFS transporter [uncultured Spirosoma sp.]|uniref:MFS transporter n=1 Tax=uncultured Spirosoma sp. TaxID=278208 RepID=UPI0025827EFA|nr:MFS transporter [uncultured Spirosoma sp.]